MSLQENLSAQNRWYCNQYHTYDKIIRWRYPMRIIAGEFRGRRLKSPKTNDVRPTSDKVKEAVFSMLLPYMKEGFVAVDVFAGSGNLGLEAISRGAGTVFFSDNSRASMALIKENIAICGAQDRSILLTGDYRSNIRRVSRPVDIFFLDPPYADGHILPALDCIRDSGKLKTGGVVVCEHSQKDHLPEEIDGYVLVKERRYGAIGVSIYEKTEEAGQ